MKLAEHMANEYEPVLKVLLSMRAHVEVQRLPPSGARGSAIVQVDETATPIE